MNWKTRLFVREYVYKPLSIWGKKIIFCDESKFNLFVYDDEQRIQRWDKGEAKCLRYCKIWWGRSVSYCRVGNLMYFDMKINPGGQCNILSCNLLASTKNIEIRPQYIFRWTMIRSKLSQKVINSKFSMCEEYTFPSFISRHT